MSWIEEQEKLLQVNKLYYREPMESIQIHYIYININNYIEKITSEKIPIENNKIDKDKVLHISQEKCFNKKYFVKDIFSYIVDLEPENVQKYSKSENFEELSRGFLKVLQLNSDIVFVNSIFVFHSVNSLYFLLYEVPVEVIEKPKSILKTEKKEKRELSKKRVTIKLKDEIHRKTRKHI